MTEYESRLQIEGRRAFEAGKQIDGCPYKSRTGHTDTNARRMNWMVGWLDARTWHERGSMFRRYGIMDDRPGSERLIS